MVEQHAGDAESRIGSARGQQDAGKLHFVKGLYRSAAVDELPGHVRDYGRASPRGSPYPAQFEPPRAPVVASRHTDCALQPLAALDGGRAERLRRKCASPTSQYRCQRVKIRAPDIKSEAGIRNWNICLQRLFQSHLGELLIERMRPQDFTRWRDGCARLVADGGLVPAASKKPDPVFKRVLSLIKQRCRVVRRWTEVRIRPIGTGYDCLRHRAR